MAAKKKVAKGQAKSGSSRKRLSPAREKRGPEAPDSGLPLDAAELAELVSDVRAAGGAPLGAYREPLSGAPLLLAMLPLGALEPTPFQRDLSPTHVKRLAQKIDESGAFLDPVICVRGSAGGFWTPNGRHRLAAAKLLGMRAITALVSPAEALAYKILALNTEKAHNTKDRSLEVIRMAQALAKAQPRAPEAQFAAEFELAAFLTLGLCYQRSPRFAGGAYLPFLRRVDRLADKPLPVALRERTGFAAKLLEIDARVKEIVAGLAERGFKSPYLRTLVVARINPVRFVKQKRGETAPAMPIGAALVRMAASAKKFDPAGVRERDLALVAAVASDDAEAE
ncbi:MAG TPA: ParB N-terminal domain-containing protein [Myxococcota bacterium]|nr:ParB N-terminal domain-containing protein [Myxococcota bacterium]